MLDFYDDHKDEIWVGFNNHHYDDYILKGILCNMNPYDINEWIITEGNPGWKYSASFRKIPLLSYDVFQHKIDRGLKFFEGSMGNMIKESSVDFRIDRPLTKAEVEEMVMYCRHDVEQTMEVFIHRKNEFDAIISLIKMFPEVLNLRDIGRTKAQMSAKILECVKRRRDDEFDLFVLPCIDIKKYRQAIDFYMSMRDKTDPEEVYSQTLTTIIAGLEHNIGWGGIHAGKKRYRNLGKSQGRQIWHVDVASFYPRLMIFHNLLTRNSREPEKFRQIYERRIALKKAGKKKEQAPLKIVINGTYGISKAKTSAAYDPRNANLICMNGQLMLIDLIEHLEVIQGFELIQSNTDGLIISLPDAEEARQQMEDICHEWENRCSMELEFDEIKTLWGQKDVNNYVFEYANGKLERKGDYLKELGALNYDLPIVTKALINALVYSVPVEDTINGCNELKEFQMIRRISYKYSHILYGGYWDKKQMTNSETGRTKTYFVWSGTDKRLKEKCIRIFASNKVRGDNSVWKVKHDGSIAKIEGSPEHCFIVNDDVNNMTCPDELDKQWYIDLANERLNSFKAVDEL